MRGHEGHRASEVRVLQVFDKISDDKLPSSDIPISYCMRYRYGIPLPKKSAQANPFHLMNDQFKFAAVAKIHVST